MYNSFSHSSHSTYSNSQSFRSSPMSFSSTSNGATVTPEAVASYLKEQKTIALCEKRVEDAIKRGEIPTYSDKELLEDRAAVLRRKNIASAITLAIPVMLLSFFPSILMGLRYFPLFVGAAAAILAYVRLSLIDVAAVEARKQFLANETSDQT